MSDASKSLSLRGWSVLCLRPRADQRAVARAVDARGGVAFALPGWRLVGPPDRAAAREQLRVALAARAVVFTSPAAVRFAARLVDLRAVRLDHAFAIGSGTARVLRRFGVVALHPGEDAMHSEGLLALPAFAALAGDVGLVSAPGGRDVLAGALRARGYAVATAHVYRRLPPRAAAREFALVDGIAAPRAVLVTSADALSNVLAVLPATARAVFVDSVAVASSERLVEAARAAGFARVLRAASPEIDSLLDRLAAAP